MSNQQREDIIEYLEHHLDDALPAEVFEMDVTALHALEQVVDGVLEKERAGFDRFFESMSQTLKYIPNFLVLAITNKYIDPPIAARITSKLPLKNAVAIAKGLSHGYISQTACYMDDRYAAELLAKLPKKQVRQVLEQMLCDHPLKMLDILAYADKPIVKLLSRHEGLESLRQREISKHRQKVLAMLIG